jgi:hypothetical protein
MEASKPLKPKCGSADDGSYVTAHLEYQSKKIIESWGCISKPGTAEYLRSVASHDLQLRNGELNDRPRPKQAKDLGGYSVEDHMSQALVHVQMYREWTPTLKAVTMAMSEDGKAADVWLTTSKHYPELDHPDLYREAVSLFQWRWNLAEREWKWCGYCSSRGPAAELF